MLMFASEAHLLETLSMHDELVRQCVGGHLSFDAFCERYQDFYAFFALDGHESDDEERALLEKYEARIEPHRIIGEDILGLVCTNEDAERESFQRAGRFGPIEAVERMRLIKLPAV